MVGCFLLNDQNAGLSALEDESHEVRAMAAWTLIRTGKKAEGFACLENLLVENSYATLKVLNILDWVGADAEVLIPVVKKMSYSNYEARMREYLVQKFESAK